VVTREAEKLSSRKRPRPTVSPAVEMAQAIARSRLHDYSSTPLLRLQPATAATTTTSSWIDDDDAEEDPVIVDRVPPCYEKKLLIAPPRSEDTNRADECTAYLSGCK